MANLFGWASIGENGKATGGAAGDQKQRLDGKGNDMVGEVKIGAYYEFGQKYVIRFKNRATGRKAAEVMKYFCNCNLIGYNQASRYTLASACAKYDYNFSKIKKAVKAGSFPKVNCDCSSLCATVINVAYGQKIVDLFTTSTAEYNTVKKYPKLFETVPLADAKKSWKKGDMPNAPGHHIIMNV